MKRFVPLYSLALVAVLITLIGPSRVAFSQIKVVAAVQRKNFSKGVLWL